MKYSKTAMITSMMESSNPLNFISNLLGKKKMTILHYIKETAKYFHPGKIL